MTQQYPVWFALTTLSALGCEHDARLGFACPGPAPTCVPAPAAHGGGSAPIQPDAAADGGEKPDAAVEPLSVSVLNQAGEIVTHAELACDVACLNVSVRVSGGTPPYDYEWSDGPTVSERALCPDAASQYTLRVRDTRNIEPVAATLDVQRASCPVDAGVVTQPTDCRRFSVGEYLACGNVGTSGDMPQLTAAPHTLRIHSNLAAAGAMQVTGVGESCSFSEPLGAFSLPTGPNDQALCLTPSRNTATLMITTTSGGSAAFLTNPDSYVELCNGCN